MQSTNPYFAIATAGKTVDGRAITANQIREMAKSYDPEIYGARIWLEHIRGYMPDGKFAAYGDVLALKTGKNKNGDLQLLAQIKALPELVKLNQAGQKVYSSIELDPDFMGTGKAYLVGLGITDSPASTGTSRLQFNRQNTQIFSNQVFLIEDTAVDNLPDSNETKPSEDKTLFAKFSQLFAKKEELEEVKEDTPSQSDISATMGLFADELQSAKACHNQAIAAQDERLNQLASELESIKQEFADMRDKFKAADEPARPDATGSQAALLTDF